MSKIPKDNDRFKDSLVREIAEGLSKICEMYEKKINSITKGKKKTSIEATVNRNLLEVHSLHLQAFKEDERFKFLDRPISEIRSELSDIAKSMTKKEVEKHFVELAISSDVHSLLCLTYRALHDEVYKAFEQIQKGRITNSSKKQAGREKIYKSNKAYLLDCLDRLKTERNGELKETDYGKFRSFVIATPPPFKPKIRESAEDKLLSPADRAKNTEEKEADRLAHNGWASVSIRDFWSKQTGLSATLKKLSPLK
jgi:hypothetical protein